MIVVDASVILEVLLATSASPPIRERLFAANQTLHAPHLLDLEVTRDTSLASSSGHTAKIELV